MKNVKNIDPANVSFSMVVNSFERFINFLIVS